ncbi:hypothetical protein KC19_8G186600 [Ceratodon purpureus]|uniref:Uncharacterized protein n=1 Tax=Ceratodon purpureus TaxID=3225 RepID=A0A8T0H4Y0_CERPU|nr:hypothetical protein KC19_8G186600 [Ceratodon purpureus]
MAGCSRRDVLLDDAGLCISFLDSVFTLHCCLVQDVSVFQYGIFFLWCASMFEQCYPSNVSSFLTMIFVLTSCMTGTIFISIISTNTSGSHYHLDDCYAELPHGSMVN